MNNEPPDTKIVKSAFYGSLGSVLLLFIAICIVFYVPGNEPSAAPIMILFAITIFIAFIYWLRGLIAIIRLLLSKSTQRSSKRAFASYMLICIPAIYFIIRTIIAGN